MTIDNPDIATDAQDPRLARQVAYRSESDALFFKWQRGEAEQQEWLDKIEEIRIRFPYV